MKNKEILIAIVETYFKHVDNGETQIVLDQLTENCEISIVTDSLIHKGRDSEIKQMFERRLEHTKNAWHGNFKHLVDEKMGWVTTRFDVKRTDINDLYREMDNINFFEFHELKIEKISIWMSGENSLK